MSLRSVVGVTFIVCLAAAATGVHTQQPSRRYIAPRTAQDASLPPFSGAVLVGNTLYLAGQTGTDPNTPAPASAEAEAKVVLDRIQATLVAAGMTMDDLVSVQVFCPDVGANYTPFNNVYRTYFKKEFPARAFIGSGPLLFSSRFEVQGIAVKR